MKTSELRGRDLDRVGHLYGVRRWRWWFLAWPFDRRFREMILECAKAVSRPDDDAERVTLPTPTHEYQTITINNAGGGPPRNVIVEHGDGNVTLIHHGARFRFMALESDNVLEWRITESEWA
jgi:hypothetical protein